MGWKCHRQPQVGMLPLLGTTVSISQILCLNILPYIPLPQPPLLLQSPSPSLGRVIACTHLLTANTTPFNLQRTFKSTSGHCFQSSKTDALTVAVLNLYQSLTKVDDVLNTYLKILEDNEYFQLWLKVSSIHACSLNNCHQSPSDGLQVTILNHCWETSAWLLF